MSTRIRTVMIAITFGLVATLGVASYINSLRDEIVDSTEIVVVFTAKTAVLVGTPADELISRGLVEKVEIPKRYAAEGAIGDLADYEGRILAVPLGVSEQLTAGKFRSADNSELTHRLPAGKIALAIPVNKVTGVGGQIRSGDKIVILATFEPGPGGKDISRVLLRNIEVLTGGADSVDNDGGSRAGDAQTVTVAVSPSEAEKLVFAQERGSVWIGLAGTSKEELPGTNGQTMESIF